MSSHQLADLPFELQIEIFSNILSVKHLVKVLSLNKSTHDQLVQSKIFWNNLINNYSKPFRTYKLSASASANDDELNIHIIKKQFYELIEMKKRQTEELKATNLKFEYMLRELEMVTQKMIEEIEYVSQKGAEVAMIDQMKLEVESLQKETERDSIKIKEIEEEFKKMQID